MSVVPVRWQVGCFRCGAGLGEYDTMEAARADARLEKLCVPCEQEVVSAPWEGSDTEWRARLATPGEPGVVTPRMSERDAHDCAAGHVAGGPGRTARVVRRETSWRDRIDKTYEHEPKEDDHA